MKTIEITVTSVEYYGFMPLNNVPDKIRYNIDTPLLIVPFGEYPDDFSLIEEIEKQANKLYKSIALVGEEEYVVSFDGATFDRTSLDKALKILNNEELKKATACEIEQINSRYAACEKEDTAPPLHRIMLDRVHSLDELHSNIFLMDISGEE